MFFASFLDLRWSKIDLQVDFGNNFCTILGHFDPLVSLVTSKILENLKIGPKSTRKFSQSGKKRTL